MSQLTTLLGQVIEVEMTIMLQISKRKNLRNFSTENTNVPSVLEVPIRHMSVNPNSTVKSVTIGRMITIIVSTVVAIPTQVSQNHLTRLAEHSAAVP